MIDTLQSVNWSVLRHAYGSAQDVPRLIAQLREPNWDEAVGELLTLLVHNGLYPATSAALPFLAEVALDPGAEGRLGALELLTSFAAALTAETPDLPAELGRSAGVVLPLAADPDPEVRIAVYEFACFWPGSEVDPQAREMLRARFAAEGDVRAQVVLMEPLARYGLLSATEVGTLRGRGKPEVVFAAVWSMLAGRADLPWAVDHLVRLWPIQAAAYPGSGAGNSLDLLVGRMGPAAVQVLQPLGEAGRASAGDLARGWRQAAEISRAATNPALEAMIELARTVSAAEAVPVVESLHALQPAAGEHAVEMADAVAGLLTRLPPEPSLLASSSILLFALQDPRWAAPALVVAGMAVPPLVSEGNTRMSLPAALAGLPTSRRPVDWAEDDLIAVAGRAIAVRPEAAAAWAEVLQLLPASSGVVDVLLSAMDLAPVVPTLVHLASADPKSFTEQARSRIAALPVGADETGAWVLTLQSLLTDDFGAFARAWEFGGTGFGADELLRIWTRHASSGLEVVCQEVVKGAVATSIPGRHLQLVAASHLVNSGDPVAAWSTVRALVDRAGEPLVPAAALAALIAELEPTLVPEWVAQLRDILERGRPTWAGPDHGAGAVAAGQLLELGELTLEQGVEQVLRAELDAVAAGQAASVTPIVTRILGRILEQRPDLRPRVAQGLEPLIAGDTRIPSAAGDIATDVRLTDLLRGLL